MTSYGFDAETWVVRLAAALRALAKVQKPYLQAYSERHPQKRIIVNGRDETPFPLDDLRMVYSGARYSRRFGTESEHAALNAALDRTRHALLSHPELDRVAVSGRNVGGNDFWMRILNRGTSIWAGDLIAGLMARAAELPSEGFRAAARELNALLSPLGDDEAAAVLGDLDEGCDLVLFYGLTVSERIEMEDGMVILPVPEARRFVEREMVEELAPSGAGLHEWRSVGAVGRPFRWRPFFRRRGRPQRPDETPVAYVFRGRADVAGLDRGKPRGPGGAAGDGNKLYRPIGCASAGPVDIRREFGLEAGGVGVRRVPGVETGGAR